MRNKLTASLLLLVLLLATSCHELIDYLDEVEPKPGKLQVKEFATGLATPMGLEVDAKGQVWVAEAGTGNNDGQVSLITPDGKVYPAIVGFSSGIDPEGNPSGLNKILLHNGILWMLHGLDDKLYKADVSSFKAGDTPLQASDLESEDVGAFVYANAVDSTEDSNLYNLALGPNQDLYIADAGANAIIRREAKSGQLSVFASIPGIANPTPIGPPFIQSVPTGIVFDGHRFLVSTLLGFPFPPDKARIYQISLNGKVSIYQDGGLTSLVDIELSPNLRPVVLEFATFTPQGFAPKTGGIVYATGQQTTTLVEGLNLPTTIERGKLNTYYVASLAEGRVLKIDQ